jgi:hypothetical protein
MTQVAGLKIAAKVIGAWSASDYAKLPGITNSES